MGGVEVGDIALHFRQLITDEEDRVKIVGGSLTLPQQRVPLLHNLVQVLEHPNLSGHRISNQLHVGPLIITKQLNPLTITQPHTVTGLSNLLNNIVQADGLTVTGTTSNEQVRILSRIPRSPLPVLIQTQQNLKLLIRLVACSIIEALTHRLRMRRQRHHCREFLTTRKAQNILLRIPGTTIRTRDTGQHRTGDTGLG